MPKRKGPALTHKIARAILDELSQYATDSQFYPVQNALYGYMARDHYNPKTRKMEKARYPDLKRWIFDYQFERLVEEGYIEIDRPTRAIRCVHLQIVEKEVSED